MKNIGLCEGLKHQSGQG